MDIVSFRRYKEFKQLLDAADKGARITSHQRQELENAINSYEHAHGISVPDTLKYGICFAGTLVRQKIEIEEFLTKSSLFRQDVPCKESTRYLVLGKNPSKKKVEQANALAIPVVSEEEFFTSEVES